MVILCDFEKKKNYVKNDDHKKPVEQKKDFKAERERLEAESTKKNETYNKMKNENFDSAEIKIREEFARKKRSVKEKVDREFELLEIRQTIYAKLSQGMHVDSMLRMFTVREVNNGIYWRLIVQLVNLES